MYTVTVYSGPMLAGQVALKGFPAPETAIVTGLDEGTLYTFYVSAANRAGTGPQSLPSVNVIPAGPVFLQ